MGLMQCMMIKLKYQANSVSSGLVVYQTCKPCGDGVGGVARQNTTVQQTHKVYTLQTAKL